MAIVSLESQNIDHFLWQVIDNQGLGYSQNDYGVYPTPTPSVVPTPIQIPLINYTVLPGVLRVSFDGIRAADWLFIGGDAGGTVINYDMKYPVKYPRTSPVSMP